MAEREDPSKMELVSRLLKNFQAVPQSRNPYLYLEPEESAFSPLGKCGISSYQLIVARTLLEPMEHEPGGERYEEIASLVCLPSFTPEWAVWVAGNRKTGFSALSTEAEASIWYSTFPAEMAVPAVRARRCQFPVDLAGAICDVWAKILSQTRYPKESRLGCDGVNYHFGYWRVGSRPLAGKTWSPTETTVPGKLAALAQNIRDYVEDNANRDVFLKVMEDQVQWFHANAH